MSDAEPSAAKGKGSEGREAKSQASAAVQPTRPVSTGHSKTLVGGACAAQFEGLKASAPKWGLGTQTRCEGP